MNRLWNASMLGILLVLGLSSCNDLGQMNKLSDADSPHESRGYGTRRERVVDAALPNLSHNESGIPKNKVQSVYFFKGSRYIRQSYMALESGEEKLLQGPHPITGVWSSLRKAKFDSVDAFLPITMNPKEVVNQAYVFSGDQYARISFIHGSNDREELRSGPYKISDNWPTLKEAGFDRVDAAFIYQKGMEKNAYIFRGDSYIKIHLADFGFGQDTLLSGPTKITDGWKTLKKVGFNTIDTIVPLRGYPSQYRPWCRAYFFSGDSYVLLKFDPEGGEEILSGPLKITSNWTLLNKF